MTGDSSDLHEVITQADCVQKVQQNDSFKVF